jgi:hypothetical protein
MSRSRNKLLLIWIVVAGLAAAIYVGERKRSASIDAPRVKDEKRLLPALIEDVSGIEIMASGAMHRFERDKQGMWFYLFSLYFHNWFCLWYGPCTNQVRILNQLITNLY